MLPVDLPAIPGFRLERLLGEGAFGRVYLADEEEGLRRPVALKLFAESGRGAYERELSILQRVEELRRQGRHPGIVQALGSGEHEGRGWIALEYLEQGSLKDYVLRSGPMPWEQALDAIEQATAGLEVLHGAGLFHRDVKPANLLLGADGKVRLGDFGLSRELDGTLSAAGSPAFAAPEVIAGRIAPDLRARIDVYGLGATLAFLLSGEAARPGRPDAFALERAGVPRAICDLVLSAMAYEPEERPADAQALNVALQGVREKLRTSSGGPEGASEETNRMKNATLKPAPHPPIADLDLEVKRPRCPFCHEEVENGDAKTACLECMAWHHEACWGEHGACAACQAELSVPAEPAAPRVPPEWTRFFPLVRQAMEGAAQEQRAAGRARGLRRALIVVLLAATLLGGLVAFARVAQERERAWRETQVAKVKERIYRESLDKLTRTRLDQAEMSELVRRLQNHREAKGDLVRIWRGSLQTEGSEAVQLRAQIAEALEYLGTEHSLLDIAKEDPAGPVRQSAYDALEGAYEALEGRSAPVTLRLEAARARLRTIAESLEAGQPEALAEALWPRDDKGDPLSKRDSSFTRAVLDAIQGETLARLSRRLERNAKLVPYYQSEGEFVFGIEAPEKDDPEACRLIRREGAWWILEPSSY